MRQKHPIKLNEEKVEELCKKFRDGEFMVNPFLDRLEKEGIPRWMGYLIVGGIQPVRADYDQVKSLCKKFEANEIHISSFTDSLEKLGIPCWVGFMIYDLKRQALFHANIGKLSPEDQEIAHRKEKERTERTKLYNQIEVLSKEKDPEAWEDLLNKINGPSHCEHGRSWASNCYACDEIDKTLFGELYPLEEDGD